MWYNEAFLAPLFLRHYDYADRIVLLYDLDSNDDTREIASACPGVRVVPFRFPDMMDDEFKIALINKQYRRAECDWVLLADADEFVFRKEGENFVNDIRPYLAGRPECTHHVVTLYQIYRHATDKDIDPDLPAVPQRRHGDPNTTVGINSLYNKPILVRRGLDLAWEPGCHHLRKTRERLLAGPEYLPGAHWSMADPAFAVERRVKNRRERQSRNNLEKGLTMQHHTVTVAGIMAEFAAHAHDPQLF